MQTRYLKFARKRGFTLLELIIVLGLSSMLTVSLFSIHQSQRSQQLFDLAAERLNVLKVAALRVMIETGSAPQSLSELLEYTEYPDADKSPWGAIAELKIIDPKSVTLSMTYQNTRGAERIAGMVAGAWHDQSKVHVEVHLPASSLLIDSLLHRHANEDNPQLNQMETDLNMNGHSLLAVNAVESESIEADELLVNRINASSAEIGYLYSERIELEKLDVDEIFAQYLHTDELSAVNLTVQDLNAATAEIGQLHTDTLYTETIETQSLIVESNLVVNGILNSHELNVVGLTTDFLQVENSLTVHNVLATSNLETDLLTANQVQSVTLFSDQIETDFLQSGTAEFNELSVTHVTVQEALEVEHLAAVNLDAGTVYASDFVTESASLNQLEVELANYQLLWQQCVDAGGCQ